MTALKITDKEREMLQTIWDSEYQDGDPVGHHVWLEYICEPFGRSAGGIMASLVKKGLAWTDGGCTNMIRKDGSVRDGGTCYITKAGAEALGKLPAEKST